MRRTTAALAAAVLVLAGVAPAVGAAVAPASGTAPTAAGSPALAPVDAPGAVATQSANCTFPVTVTDATGTEVTVEAAPERVTTLAPSAAQTMWEIGGREQVVGVSGHASYLDGTDALTNVSASGFGVSVEAVVGTTPDLVLAPNVVSTETVTALREAGLTVYHARLATNVSDVREKTTHIGRLTGNCAGAAEANAWMTANVEAAANATADVDRPTALYPLGGGYVANTGTYISALIEAAGADNVVGEANVTGAYPQVSAEVIVELAPEYLVITESSAYLTAEEPYASTPAVAENNTVTVGTNYLNQPAPRSVVYAVRNLTRGFHPAVDAEFVSRTEVDLAANATTDAAESTGTAEPTAADATTASATPATTDAATDGATPTADEATATTAAAGTGTETTAPGFGAALAALAVVAGAFLARRGP